MAKFRSWASFNMNVVMPSRLPWASNSPPPDEPFEMGADVWNRRPASRARLDEMIPSARLSSKPWGAPRDLIVDAWLDSANTPIGYPMFNVRDIESGKVRATRELFGAD